MESSSMALAVTEVSEAVTMVEAEPVPVVDYTSTLELGFSAIVLGIGLIAGLIFSKIVNWWKW